MGHTFSDLNIHLIFSTKHRRNLLSPEISQELYPYIKYIVEEQKAQLLAINGVEDHIHLLLRIKATSTITDLVRHVKGGSSHWVHQNHPELQHFSWQAGYAVFSVSHSALKNVTEYIQSQRQHHHKKSFLEEYKTFLEKHEVAFPPDEAS